MSEGKRPGGLTALAVLNFVFGGFSCFGVLGMMAVFAIKSGAIPLQEDQRNEASKALAELPDGFLYGLTAVYAASAFLLIATGVGYLKQKKFWGRVMGNVYALLSIGTTVVVAYSVSEKANGGFNLGTILGLIYPVLTLVLINTTFKEDLVR